MMAPCFSETPPCSTHKLPVSTLFPGNPVPSYVFLGTGIDSKQLYPVHVVHAKLMHPGRDIGWQATIPQATVFLFLKCIYFN